MLKVSRVATCNPSDKTLQSNHLVLPRFDKQLKENSSSALTYVVSIKGILWDIYECAQKSCLGVNFMAQWDQKVTKKGIFLTILYRGFGWVPPVSLSICKSVSHTFSDFCPRLCDLTKRQNCGGRHGGQHGFESLYSLLSS